MPSSSKPSTICMNQSVSEHSLLTEVAVSRQLRIPLTVLRKWRAGNQGPLFVKVGSVVRYRQSDVEAWLERELRIRCDYK